MGSCVTGMGDSTCVSVDIVECTVLSDDCARCLVSCGTQFSCQTPGTDTRMDNNFLGRNDKDIVSHMETAGRTIGLCQSVTTDL